MSQNKCSLCGEPMPVGEEIFKIHGYSGPCPKPPIKSERDEKVKKLKLILSIITILALGLGFYLIDDTRIFFGITFLLFSNNLSLKVQEMK